MKFSSLSEIADIKRPQNPFNYFVNPVNYLVVTGNLVETLLKMREYSEIKKTVFNGMSIK